MACMIDLNITLPLNINEEFEIATTTQTSKTSLYWLHILKFKTCWQTQIHSVKCFFLGIIDSLISVRVQFPFSSLRCDVQPKS